MDGVLNPGDILNDRYYILNQLGQGGFGRTYLAEDINRFREKCVLKEFAPRFKSEYALKKAKELFEREAEVLYRLQNKHIPKFRELFSFEYHHQERLFLVQDYINGQTYYTIFQNRDKTGIKFNQGEIRQLLIQLLPVLEYIHSLGVIHRDISPENVMLRSSDGLAMLIDFGSIKDAANKAQFLDHKSPNPTVSLQGTILGKSGYAPPEQIVSGVISYHSDLYSLAATAVVLLAGKEPQDLIDSDGFQWHLHEQVNVDPHLGWILNKMLSPNPRNRFPTAKQVMEALQNTNKHPIGVSLRRQKLSLAHQLNDFVASPRIWLYLTLITVAWVIAIPLWLDINKKSNMPTGRSDLPNFPQIDTQLSERFSQGEKILITPVVTQEKELAIFEFAAGNYQKAAFLLQQSLLNFPNDPESLVYLNNAQIGEQKAYRIAVSIPIGSDISAAQEILRGVAQAQNQINQQGGIRGIPLKVIIANDDNNSDIAIKIAIKLSENPEILGVVGHYDSNVTLATAKVYESKKLVLISPVSTSVELSNFSPYVFRTVPSDYIAARALADYMLEKINKQNVAIFYNSRSNYSLSLKSEFATAVSLGGGRIVHEFDLASNDFSAAESIKKSISGKAEALMLAADIDTLDRALQVVRVNRQRLSMLAGGGVYSLKTLEVVGESAENTTIAIPWHIKQHLDTEFVKTAYHLWQGEVNWRTATAYDATQVLIKALQSNPTRMGIQQVLSGDNFSATGASSQVNFSPSGDLLQGIQLVEVVKSNQNYLGYEFAPISK